MPVYQESGLTVSLADDNHFRFCDCRTYQKLSGSFLKEMDFGWWHTEQGCLYLMELKDFSSLTADNQLADKFIEDIILCVVDCLLMLSAIWTNSKQGQSLHADLTQTCPAFSRQLCQVKIVIVIKIESRHSKLWLSPLQDRLRSRIKSKVSLLDIDPKNDLKLLTHEVAKKLGLPVDY